MPDQRALLSEAIQSSTDERLRVTLQRICDANPEAFEQASRELLEGPKSAVVGPTPAAQGQKRKLKYTRQRYEICSQCDEEYDVMENKKGEPLCSWHEGMDLLLVERLCRYANSL
jgi:hypothetical protein